MMQIEGIVREKPPFSTSSTDHFYYEGVFTVIGSEQEVDEFKKYISRYKPSKAILKANT